LRAALESAGGTVMLDARVTSIDCDGERVRGVTLTDGTTIPSPVVVSACNPHDTFLRWLADPPRGAGDLVDRWSRIPHADGYESKLDAVVTDVPRIRAIDAPLVPSTIIAPSLDDIDRGARSMTAGEMIDPPAMLVNVPTVLDPTMAPPGRHVFSLEALYTPYRVQGGWPGSSRPERWLHAFAAICEPGFLDSIVEWRAMTPDVYERDFHLPAGHATSFAGGPLAAFRNPNPELTRYETAVDGLYLTGAATFPGAGVWGASGRNCAAVVLEHRS